MKQSIEIRSCAHFTEHEDLWRFPGGWGLNCNSEIIPERTWVNSSELLSPLIQKWQGKWYLCLIGKTWNPGLSRCALFCLWLMIHFKSWNHKITIFKSGVIATKLQSLHFCSHMTYFIPLIKLRFSLKLLTKGVKWNYCPFKWDNCNFLSIEYTNTFCEEWFYCSILLFPNTMRASVINFPPHT